MGVLENGKWVSEAEYSDNEGKFVRQNTKFRDMLSVTGEYTIEKDRYHLYVSYACPWATRVIIMLNLKGLQNVISMSVVSPHMADNGWEFGNFKDSTPDQVNNKEYLWQVYTKADPNCSGRVTVPVLWDKKTNSIVNNESKDIMRMLDLDFGGLAENNRSYYPQDLMEHVDKTIDAIYNPINNGVYRAGFATKQDQYEKAVNELFENLDKWEETLSKQRFLCGNVLTEADICMFTTLYRFDPVYYVHFKCNIKKITEYPNLWNYTKDLYQTPGFKEACNLVHVKQHYYWSHPFINPHRIVPVGPQINYDEKHDREKFGLP